MFLWMEPPNGLFLRAFFFMRKGLVVRNLLVIFLMCNIELGSTLWRKITNANASQRFKTKISIFEKYCGAVNGQRSWNGLMKMQHMMTWRMVLHKCLDFLSISIHWIYIHFNPAHHDVIIISNTGWGQLSSMWGAWSFSWSLSLSSSASDWAGWPEGGSLSTTRRRREPQTVCLLYCNY